MSEIRSGPPPSGPPPAPLPATPSAGTPPGAQPAAPPGGSGQGAAGQGGSERSGTQAGAQQPGAQPAGPQAAPPAPPPAPPPAIPARAQALPPDLARAPAGTTVEGEVRATADGQVTVRTDRGDVRLDLGRAQAAQLLRPGTPVSIEIRSTTTQPPVVLISPRSAAGPGSTPAIGAGPAVTAGSAATAPTVPLAVGRIVQATVVPGPAQPTAAAAGSGQPAASQPAASQPAASQSTPVTAPGASGPAPAGPAPASPAPASPAVPGTAPVPSAGAPPIAAPPPGPAGMAVPGTAVPGTAAFGAPAAPASPQPATAPLSAPPPAGPPPAVPPPAAPSATPPATSASPAAGFPAASGALPAASRLAAYPSLPSQPAASPTAVAPAVPPVANPAPASPTSQTAAAQDSAPRPGNLANGAVLTVRIASIADATGRPDGTARAITGLEHRDASSGQPPRIAGQIAGVTAAGRPVVQSPVGFLALDARADLRLGTRIALDVLASRGGAVADRSAPLPVLAREWPALDAALRVLEEQIGPAAARQAVASMPRPGPQLTAALVFFMAALRGGDVRSWLGRNAVQTLESSERGGGLLKALADDFQTLQRAAEPTEAGWRSFLIPIAWGERRPIRLLTRRERRDGRDGRSGKPGTAFLVDLELTNIGPFRLDGLVRNELLDLLIRTITPLPGVMRRDIKALMDGTLERTGIVGRLAFRASPVMPPLPVDLDASATGDTTTVTV